MKSKVLKMFFGLLFLTSLILNLKFAGENIKLEKKLDTYLQRIDNFYGQLDELSFILNQAGQKITKDDVLNAVTIYTKQRIAESKKRGYETIEIPPSKLSKEIYGFHSEIKFIFDENNQLSKFDLRKYSPTYLRVN